MFSRESDTIPPTVEGAIDTGKIAKTIYRILYGSPLQTIYGRL
jgi:hypothetical protein